MIPSIGGEIGEIVGILIALVVIWIIVSLPVYVAAKIVKGSKATLGRAMLATLFGPIVFILVIVFTSALLVELGIVFFFLPVAIAFIAFLGVYKSVLKTGWLGAFGISIIATVILAIAVLILSTSLLSSIPLPIDAGAFSNF